jgi:hypothetical protein
MLLATSAAVTSLAAGGPAAAQTINYFSPGDLVISMVSNVSGGSGSGLDTASPLVLRQFQLGAGGTSATAAGTLTLPQTSSGLNSAISGEYGSASEGLLQLSANGQYLTIMGYGVNAAAFNSAPVSTYGTAALGQTVSLTPAQQTGTKVTTVPRVVALVGANASVDTTTALTGVFNANNPRSAATVDGSSIYVAGQGVTGDGTGGLFVAARGATTATAINANTTTPSGSPNGTANPLLATETRSVQIVNTGTGNSLQVSRDYGTKGSPNDTTDIRKFTNGAGGLPTSASGLVATRIIPGNTNSSGGNTGSIDVTNATDNGVNHARNGQTPGHTGNTFVYLSPEEFYYANASTLYIADSGSPKNGANAAGLGEGGLQKWINSAADGSGVWSLAYDMVTGLNLTAQSNANSATPTAPGVTGLFGLTGEVVGGEVELFATSYGLNELSASYLYEITDNLANTDYTVGDAETFNTLYSAPAGSLIRGVSFAAVPEPGSVSLVVMGLAGLLLVRQARSSARV